MSTFIVSRKTMRCVVSGIVRLKHNTFSADADHQKRKIMELAEDYMRKHQFECSPDDAVGCMLYEFNKRAVITRYGEDKEEPTTEYRHSDFVQTDVQFLRSLQCLIYQCAEEVNMNTELFDRLKALEQDTMMYLIKKRIPEYNETNWDRWD